MKLTPRGKLSVAALIAFSFSALLFNDIIISIVFMGLGLLVLSELIWMAIIVSRPGRFFILSSSPRAEAGKDHKTKQDIEEISKTIALGEVASQDLFFTVSARAHVALSTNIPYLKLAPIEFKSNVESSRVHFEFRSPYAGIYNVEKIEANFRGPLDLFEASLGLDVLLRYSVYPKVYDIVLTSSKILGKAGIGEIPTEFPGIGTEFYDMREYQSGDDIRHVNWKATARFGELIVNDHAKEVGASYYLVLESSSTNYFDRDRLASTFLQIANILSLLGANFGLIVHDGKKVTSFKKIDRPQDSLLFALNAALDLAEISKERLPEELASLSSHRINFTRDMLSKQGLALLAQIEDFAQKKMKATLDQGVFKTILDIMKENPSEPPAVIYVSAMRSSIAPLIEIADQLKRAYNAEFIVVDPAKPWVVAEDEPSAAKLYETHLRNLRVLNNSGIEYHVGDPLQVSEQVFA